MNSNKQLINLAGTLVVVILLVAGVALIALPMYSQSQTIDGQTRSVAQTNSVYEQQIAQLSAAEARIDEIDSELAALRDEIAAAPELDDVHRIIADAAQAVDARVETISASDPESWAAREIEEEKPPAPAPESTEAGTAGADAGTPAADGGAPTRGAGAPAASTGQQQVVLTISIDLTSSYNTAAPGDQDAEASSDDAADDTDADLASLDALAARATKFVDLLGAGPRLVTPINVAYSDGKVTVSALTYFQTEGS